MKKILLMLSVIVVMVGCFHKNKKENRINSELNKVITDDSGKKEPKSCTIIGSNIEIRAGAGKNFNKIINKIASEKLGYTYYCTIDNSVKVIVEEELNGWSKIKVVSPSHLSDSHVGWIPSDVIDCSEHDYSQKLDTSFYKIISTNHNNTVQNFKVLIKIKFDQKSLIEFALRFKNEYCERNCNIEIYDAISISDLIDKYPLNDKEYLKVADHFVGSMSFESDYLSYYPFRDARYKELGGKNWKKEPTKIIKK